MATPTPIKVQKTGSSSLFLAASLSIVLVDFFPWKQASMPKREKSHPWSYLLRIKHFPPKRNPPSDTVELAAILSVYNKTGLLDLAKGLTQQGIRLLASGGTASLIRDAGIPVK